MANSIPTFYDHLGREIEPVRAPVSVDTKIHSQPFGWEISEWSPGLIALAIWQAKDGVFELLNDVIDTLLLEDDRIKSTMLQRRMGLTGLPLTFTQGGKNKRRKTKIEKQIESDWYQIVPEHELTRIFDYGTLAGFCWCQAKWYENQDGRTVPVLEAWDPRWCRYEDSTGMWSVQTQEDGWIELDFRKPAIASKWFLYAPYGRRHPWKMGLWRTLAWWALIKRYCRNDWARYSEVHSFPTWLITTPEGWTQQKDREKAAEQFRKLGRDKAVAVPKGVDVKVIEAVSQGWQGFQQLFNEGNMAIVLAIMTQNLTSEVTKGAKASTTVHAEIANNVLKSDAETLASFFHFGPFKWWTYLNHGIKAEAPWGLWDTTPSQDMEAKARTSKTIIEAAAAAKTKFLDFDERAFFEEWKIPMLPPGTGQALASDANAQDLTPPPADTTKSDAADQKM